MTASFTTEAFTLLSLGIVAIALRTVARLMSVGLRGFQFDDYLMLGAAVIYSFETATAYIAEAWWLGFANNGMTDEERRTLDVGSHEYSLRIGGSKTQLIGWCLYTLLLWMLKLCMCGFYSRLTSGIHHLEIRVRIGYGLIVVTYLATKLSILLGCQPYSDNWRIYPNPGNYCQPAVSHINLYVTAVLNVTTDLYLMFIPISMLWNMNLGLRRKFFLVLIFGAGLFVMIAGILRCVSAIKDPTNGIQTATSWALRETFVATLLTNAPMIHPLFLHGVSKASSYHSSSSDRATGSVRLNSSLGTNAPPPPARTPTMTTLDDDGAGAGAPSIKAPTRRSTNRLSALLSNTGPGSLITRSESSHSNRSITTTTAATNRRSTATTAAHRLSSFFTTASLNSSKTHLPSTTYDTTPTPTTPSTKARNRSSSRLSSLLLNIHETASSDDDADDVELATTTKRKRDRSVSRTRSRSRAASAATMGTWRPGRPRSASPAASSALSMGGIMVKKEAVVSSEERRVDGDTTVSNKHASTSSKGSEGGGVVLFESEDGGGGEGGVCVLRPEGEGLEYTAFVGRGDGCGK